MQHTDKMRAEFERTSARDLRRQPPKGNNYIDPMAQTDWLAFQKGWMQSRAALVVTIEPGDCFSPNDCGDLAIWRDDAKRLLEAAGVTVRGERCS